MSFGSNFLDELEGLLETPEDKREGMTTGEIAKRKGWGDAKARKYIKAAIEAGKLVPCKKTIENMAGEKQPVKAYREP